MIGTQTIIYPIIWTDSIETWHEAEAEFHFDPLGIDLEQVLIYREGVCAPYTDGLNFIKALCEDWAYYIEAAQADAIRAEAL